MISQETIWPHKMLEAIYLLQGVAVTAIREHKPVLEHFVTLAPPWLELDLPVLVAAPHHGGLCARQPVHPVRAASAGWPRVGAGHDLDAPDWLLSVDTVN